MYRLKKANTGMQSKFKKTKGFNKYKYCMFFTIRSSIKAMYLRLRTAKKVTPKYFILTGENLILQYIPRYIKININNNKNI